MYRFQRGTSHCVDHLHHYCVSHVSVSLPVGGVPGSGTLCASWQCLEVPRGPPPSLAVQFVGSGASLSGMSVELVGSRYRMSLVKKRFATGKYMAGCSL
ncbi:F-BAR domain only protein 1-like [Micropterus salmoides]|uniref:F-BAR domain only protein 1-like n=1 Tax=Micropterus salmoides TaxID=27706 RepID=UPI0018EC2FBA|nr:F-BAR domain only protein 1-like [Micropterus salmoides]